jgi:hypothetical protein
VDVNTLIEFLLKAARRNGEGTINRAIVAMTLAPQEGVGDYAAAEEEYTEVNIGNSKKSRLNDNLDNIQAHSGYAKTEGNTRRIDLIKPMMDEWDIDNASVTNLMWMTAKDFHLLLEDYRVCIGSKTKRPKHHAHTVRTEKKEDEGHSLWTQDPKGVVPSVYATRETTVNATTLSKAMRYGDQCSRDWQSSRSARVEHSPSRKRRQTSMIELAKDGMTLKANTRRGRTKSPPGTRHLRTLTHENSGGSSTTACMKQGTGQKKG